MHIFVLKTSNGMEISNWKIKIYPHLHHTLRGLQNVDPISWSFAKNFALFVLLTKIGG